MRAMVLHAVGQPLTLQQWPTPQPQAGRLRLRVEACGVCRTDLHVVDGELPGPRLPLVPGHQIVGEVDAVGSEVPPSWLGRRVGVPWMGGTCGTCSYCLDGRENLCDAPTFTGHTVHGGFAEWAVADPRYCFDIPTQYDPVAAAPLLCAGLIGHRALRMAGDPRRLGLFGFGAAAHIVIQIAVAEGREVFAFTREGDDAAQSFAARLGAVWAGAASHPAPVPLDAAIIFAPVGELVPIALRAVRKGGVVVCGGIHMTDIPTFPYADLWGERVLRSVANLTREDGEALLRLAPRIPIRTQTQTYALAAANEALQDLRAGRVEGAAVVVPADAQRRP